MIMLWIEDFHIVQVTSYMHKDDNNLWVLRRRDSSNENLAEELSVYYVRDGDFVRLQHLNTGKYLQITNESAPITWSHYQVTAFEKVNFFAFNLTLQAVFR